MRYVDEPFPSQELIDCINKRLDHIERLVERIQEANNGVECKACRGMGRAYEQRGINHGYAEGVCSACNGRGVQRL